MTAKPAKPTRADLTRKIAELEAQLAFRIAFASREIEKASDKHLTASAAVLTITALGGRVIVPPTAINDGLSAESISALKADFARSYARATEHKPA